LSAWVDSALLSGMFVHPSRRYRLYIDETGTQTLKRGHYDRFLCLFGVAMLQETHDGPTTTALYQIKADLFGHTPDAPVILHRREMVRGEAPFTALKHDADLCAEFERRWTAFVQGTPFIAYAGAIDKDAHLERYRVWQHDPYHYCLEILLERYVQWLERNKFVGDVLIEGRDKYQDKRLKKAYERFQRNGNDHVSAERAQAVLLSGQVKFGNKADDIAAHQLADSLAHPALRYLRTQHLGEPPAVGFGARLVDLLLDQKFARSPWTGRIPGWGHKWLP